MVSIAFTTHGLYGGEVHADCIAAVERAARLCESLGHHVEEAAPDLDGERFIDHFLVFWSHTPRRLIDGLTAQRGAPPPRDAFEPWTWGLAERFHGLPDDALPRALAFAADAAQRMQAFHASFDLWLTPVLASPALRIGELDGSTPYAQALEEAITYVAFTPIANATGQPSMSVPLHWNDGGLPIGALFTGQVGAEATLFALAKQLETAQPWASRWPAVSALPG